MSKIKSIFFSVVLSILLNSISCAVFSPPNFNSFTGSFPNFRSMSNVTQINNNLNNFVPKLNIGNDACQTIRCSSGY